MAANLDASCPLCLQIHRLPNHAITWHLPHTNRVDAATNPAAEPGFYTFPCPDCGPVYQAAPPIVARALIRGNVPATHWPAELTDPHRAATVPPLDVDDLIDLHLALFPARSPA